MELELAKELTAVVNEYTDKMAVVYEDYSGRGMYGRKTSGISMDGTMGDLLGALVEAISQDDQEVIDNLQRMDLSGAKIQSDSMGLDRIIY